MRETYTQFALYAVAAAVAVSLISWAVEFLLRRHVGVYLAWGLILATTTFTALTCYNAYTRCRNEITLSNCEWNPLIYLMALNLMLLTIPLLVFSTIKLKKWSDIRKQRLV
jgi:ABC-type branched-subunit amino acid transport system permease subunit